MSTSQVLQHLYSLDTSSPDLLNRLHCLIQHDQEDQYLSSLQGSELDRLVDFLDEVRVLPSASRSLTKRTLQALGFVPSTNDVSRQCLHRLQVLCGHHMTLPSSYTIPGDLIRVGHYPIASGGFADVWEGIHGDKKVCIKSLRVCMDDLETVTQVRIQHWHVHLSIQERLSAQ